MRKIIHFCSKVSHNISHWIYMWLLVFYLCSWMTAKRGRMIISEVLVWRCTHRYSLWPSSVWLSLRLLSECLNCVLFDCVADFTEIMFDPILLQWSCSPLNGHLAAAHKEATSMQAKWIRPDLNFTNGKFASLLVLVGYRDVHCIEMRLDQRKCMDYYRCSLLATL